MRKILILSAVLSLSLAACRGNDGEDAADGGSGPDATIGSATSVYDVQSESVSVGSSVSLRSVVVTAIDGFGGRTGGFYVQETEGGEFSGVFVFGANASGIAVGDLVDVDGGVKAEFALNDFPDGHSITQVVASDGGSITVTKVGDGTVPAPKVLNPWDLAASDAESEKWEGVLIRFDGARALASAYEPTTTDETLLEMSITGPYRMGGSLVSLDREAVSGDCYSSITGIGDYFFSYKILPRSTADMVVDVSGASCLPLENTAGLCADMMDNDHNGFDDCSDRACQDSVDACTENTTVEESQNGTIAEQTRVRLTNVVVTAVSEDNRKFWVQDSTGAKAFNGLYVFRPGGGDVLPANVVAGNLVTIAGVLDEYEGSLTELTNVTIEVADGSTGTINTLDGISFANLKTVKDYEGVLVSIPSSTVVDGKTCAPAPNDDICNFSIGTPGDTLYANDEIFEYQATAGQCYGTFDGVMHYDTFNDRIVVMPVAGLTPTGC